MRYAIAIEETVVEKFIIEAMKVVAEKYKKGEIILSPMECQFKQMAIVYPKKEMTEWIEF